MKLHTIRPGDCLANIAYEHGLLVETVWDHPDNAGLRERRPDMNILMPGDVVRIPERRDRAVVATTDRRHRYRLKGVPHVFRLQLFDDELVRDRQPYRLSVRGRSGTVALAGVTDDDGVLTAYIAPGTIDARLSIDETERYPALELDILFGSLDPVEEWTGIQKRLANLGFACPVDGQPSGETTQALEAFQHRFGLPMTGEADAATRALLTQMNEQVNAFPAEPAQQD
jgi:N-acetylmuramoyl-L-alanine amidase